KLNNCSALNRVIEESGLMPGMFFHRDSPSPDLESPTIRAWVEEMKGGHHFPDLPPPPFTGVATYDRLASDIWSDFRNFQSVARELFGSYDQITRAPLKADDYRGWEWRLLREGSHDRWPSSTVHLLALLGDFLGRNPANPKVQACLD